MVLRLMAKIVVSKSFEGQKLLQRHRTVNQALSELMPRIHALEVKAWTPGLPSFDIVSPFYRRI